MSIFTDLFRQKKRAPRQVKSVSFDRGSFLGYALRGGFITAADAYNFYTTSSAVATAVDLISDAVQAIDPVIKYEDGTLETDHEVLKLLRSPNPAEGYRQFIGTVCRNWLLTNDFYVGQEGAIDRLPSNIWAVKSLNVSVSENGDDRYPQVYMIGSGPCSNVYNREERKRVWRFIANPFSELSRVMGFGSDSGYARPDSPLQAAATEVRQQVQGRWHNLKLLENGGRLSLVAIFKDTMSAEQHAQRAEDIKADLGGSENAGKIAVISSEDMELKEFGSSNKDMDYAALDQISSTAIFLRYKIPLPLISTDASTYNNMEQAKYDLYDRAVIPAFEVIMEGLTSMLMPKIGLDPKKVKISYDPESIVALRGRLLEEIKVRKEINIESINELRSLLPNREPLSQGGDSVYIPGTMVPVAADEMTADNYASVTERAKGKLKDGNR